MFDLRTICQQLPPTAAVIGFAIYAVFEYLIGKTKFGSALGLLLEHPALTIFNWIKGKQND